MLNCFDYQHPSLRRYCFADNVTANAGSGGPVFATDDIAGVQHTRVKLEWGPDGTVNEVDDATGKRLPVIVPLGVAVNSLPAIPAGTNNIGDVDLISASPTAHDAADAGNPLKVGGRARGSDLVPLTENDRSDVLTDLLGQLLVTLYGPPENSIDGATAAITGTADTPVIAAQGAGIRSYLTQLIITNKHATIGTLVEIKDGTTVKQRVYCHVNGGGATLTFPKALRGSAATAWNAACITTGAEVYVSASGYKAAN